MTICILGRANYKLMVRRFEYIASLGHQIHVISLQSGEIEGCTVHYIAPITKTKADYILLASKILRKIKEINPDVVDMHGVSSYGLFALVIKNYPKIVTVYGPDLYMHVNRFPLMKNLLRSVIRNVDAVYGSTEAIHQYLKDYLDLSIGDKLKIKSWGIPYKAITQNAATRRKETRAKYNVSDDTKVIIHSRRLLKFWRIPMIIDALAEIVKENKKVELWLVYPPLDTSEQVFKVELEAQIKRLGIEEHVKFLGGFDYQSFITVNHGADIFMCIGENDLLASTLIEGMCTNLVPILVELPAYHEVIRNTKNGFLISDLSIENVSKTTLKVLKDYKTIHQSVIAHNQMLLSTEYDEEKCAEWLLDLYQEISNQFKESK